jgi:hypothetical protein
MLLSTSSHKWSTGREETFECVSTSLATTRTGTGATAALVDVSWKRWLPAVFAHSRRRWNASPLESDFLLVGAQRSMLHTRVQSRRVVQRCGACIIGNNALFSSEASGRSPRTAWTCSTLKVLFGYALNRSITPTFVHTALNPPSVIRTSLSEQELNETVAHHRPNATDNKYKQQSVVLSVALLVNNANLPYETWYSVFSQLKPISEQYFQPWLFSQTNIA